MHVDENGDLAEVGGDLFLWERGQTPAQEMSVNKHSRPEQQQQDIRIRAISFSATSYCECAASTATEIVTRRILEHHEPRDPWVEHRRAYEYKKNGDDYRRNQTQGDWQRSWRTELGAAS